ncbi:MAG: hypothetical protein Q9220_003389 [cf. Caloplaca sp. 1 TL-2023]
MAGSRGKEWRRLLREACESVESGVQPLLHGWLREAQDETEALEFEQIRQACLPEVLLACITVLNFGARYISRDKLLKSLELGAAVAAKESDLTECFVAAGRMSELVDAMAVISTNMLVAEEYSHGKKKVSAKMALWSSKGSAQEA